MIIVDHLSYFLGRETHGRGHNIEEVFQLDEQRMSPSEVRQRAKDRRLVILTINWAVLFVCLGSFFAVVGLSFAGRSIPDVLQNAFTLTLGYYVSSLVTYIEKHL